jgi:hypothetical protein
MRCHRQARASALVKVPSGCGLLVGRISLPSRATIRLRPPHLRTSTTIGRAEAQEPYLATTPALHLSARALTLATIRAARYPMAGRLLTSMLSRYQPKRVASVR